eukprot:8479805-Alexandrium_andersonii.AAC.1
MPHGGLLPAEPPLHGHSGPFLSEASTLGEAVQELCFVGMGAHWCHGSAPADAAVEGLQELVVGGGNLAEVGGCLLEFREPALVLERSVGQVQQDPSVLND